MDGCVGWERAAQRSGTGLTGSAEPKSASKPVHRPVEEWVLWSSFAFKGHCGDTNNPANCGSVQAWWAGWCSCAHIWIFPMRDGWMSETNNSLFYLHRIHLDFIVFWSVCNYTDHSELPGANQHCINIHINESFSLI